MIPTAAETLNKSVSVKNQKRDELNAKKAADVTIQEQNIQIAIERASIEVEKLITQESNKGNSEVVFHVDYGRVAQYIIDLLTPLGYKVSTKWYSYDTNMGDTEAPCMVHYEGYSVKISW